MLIGSDYYWDIIESMKIHISPGLYLIDSKLGWILTGRMDHPNLRGECAINSLYSNEAETVFQVTSPKKDCFLDLALINVLKNSRFPP